MVEYEETPFGTVVHCMKDLLKPKCENCKQLRARVAELNVENEKLNKMLKMPSMLLLKMTWIFRRSKPSSMR